MLAPLSLIRSCSEGPKDSFGELIWNKLRITFKVFLFIEGRRAAIVKTEILTIEGFSYFICKINRYIRILHLSCPIGTHAG